MFKTRLISGIILVALAILFIWLGGPVLLIVLGALSLIGEMELLRIRKIHKTRLAGIVYGMTAALYTGLYFLPLARDFFLIVMITAAFLLLASVFVFSWDKFSAQDLMIAFLAFFYVAVLFSFMYRTRDGLKGELLVWLIFLTSWGADTTAYCAGKLFGKHKMAPVLSPKKTWEGAIGGIVGAAALTAIFCAVFRERLGLMPLDILFYAGFGALASIVSIVGDLFASAIKRSYEVKDYGKLIPGHGGVLDRFDSVLFTAPVIYYATVVLGMLGRV